MRRAVVCLLAVVLLFASQALSQAVAVPSSRGSSLSWTPFGNNLVLAGMAGYASGPVERVWRGGNGEVFVRLEEGDFRKTSDFVSWTPAPDAVEPAVPESIAAHRAPAGVWLAQAHPMQPATVYAVGRQIYRSVDGGQSFAGLTRYWGVSLVGESIVDLALNPADPDDLLAASELGLWRSRDGGDSWFPVSTGLDNLPMRRIVAFPQGRRGLTVEQPGGTLLEWLPGAVNGWRPRAPLPDDPWAMPPVLAAAGNALQAWDRAGNQLYAGLPGGRLRGSPDRGATWLEYQLPGWQAARQIVANPANPQIAIGLMEDQAGRTLLLRTLNGGLFWEDHTPMGLTEIRAVAPDWEQNRIFLALPDSLLAADYDFLAMSRPTGIRQFRFEGLRSDLRELRLDPSGTLLFAVSARAGVFVAPVPGESRGLRVRHAADLGQRPAAPGDLLSIHGPSPVRLRAGGREAPILAAGEHGTQVQLPYSLTADRAALELEFAAGAPERMTVPVRRVSPAVFLHPDGSPFILHGETGAFIDENFPAVPGERIQVMASGLGVVRPEWPAGLPVPAETPPAVIASVEVRVNGLRVGVERATLAPGYAGIYLVEFVLPFVMDEGLAELQVLADGIPSNLVAVHVAYP